MGPRQVTGIGPETEDETEAACTVPATGGASMAAFVYCDRLRQCITGLHSHILRIPDNPNNVNLQLHQGNNA